jgi:hypothetical protein
MTMQDKNRVEDALDALLSGKARTRPGYAGKPPVCGGHGSRTRCKRCWRATASATASTSAA